MHRKLYFTNARGETILLDGAVKPLLLNKLDVGGAPAEVQMQKAPYQDGMTYLSTLLNPRYLTVEGSIWTTNVAEIQDRRQKLIRVFNPKMGIGRLRLEIGDIVREADATVDTPIIFPERSGTPVQRFTFTLVCPDPALQDPHQETWTLASFIGGFSFPFSFPISFGSVGQELDLENQGDLDAPVFIRFEGPLTNPVLENETTGQRITITREIQAGEILEVNTAFGQKSVTIIDADGSRSNGFHFVSPDSEFWQLVPGLNRVSYAATEESGSAAVTLSYYHRYSGV